MANEKPAWQQALENARGGTQSNSPKLGVVKSFTIEANPGSGELCFSWWASDEPNENGGTGKRKYFKGELKGVFIGEAMQASVFHEDLGRNGGNYQSALYTRKESIVMYGPDGTGKNKKVFTGNKDEVEQWAAINTSAKSLKIRRIWFVLIEKIGLAMIDTNISIAIFQLDKIKDSLATNFVVITPDRWSLNHPDLSKTIFQEKRLPIVQKNPPSFANIKVGPSITEEFVVQYKLIEQAENFRIWREWKDKGGKSVEDKPEEQKTGLPHNAAPIYNPHTLPEPEAHQGFPDLHEDESNDLPF